MINFAHIPKILKHQRAYEGLTQKDVAEQLGIPYQDYQKYEYGESIPGKERFRDLCTILKLPITNDFYHLTDEKPVKSFMPETNIILGQTISPIKPHNNVNNDYIL